MLLKYFHVPKATGISDRVFCPVSNLNKYFENVSNSKYSVMAVIDQNYIREGINNSSNPVESVDIQITFKSEILVFLYCISKFKFKINLPVV
jgi:hypothetical protein